MNICHIQTIFQPSVHTALKPFCATFLNGSQTHWELPHTVKSSSCFQLRLQGDPPSPPITSLSAGKRAIQFLKAAVSILCEMKFTAENSTFLKTGTVKHLNTAVLKFSFCSFLLNVNSHVSLSPSISEYPPTYKIGIILSSHPFQTQHITHLCTYIHKLKGQSMVVGTYLLKDESKTDSHLECELTTA